MMLCAGHAAAMQTPPAERVITSRTSAAALRDMNGWPLTPEAHERATRASDAASSLAAASSADRAADSTDALTDVLTLSVAGDAGDRAGPGVTDVAEIDELVASRTNFKGEQVEAAATKFFEDFDDGVMGPEWSASAPIVERPGTGKFIYVENSSVVLNLLTKEGAVYSGTLDLLLFPHGAREDEGEDVEAHRLTIYADGQVVFSMTPDEVRALKGAVPKPGMPIVRKIRVPFTAGFGIAEIRIEGAATREGDPCPVWGVDNILVDLGLQDPVFGVSSRELEFETGVIGPVDASAGLTGLLPPGSRYGNNDFDFSSEGGSGGGGRSTPPPEVPGPGAALMGLLAGGGMVSRRRRA
jgi:hypothetical protein